MRFFNHLKESWSFDPRSMALYRFLMGIIVMSDVIYRLPDLVNHYTDIGLVPRSLFINELGVAWSTSIHLLNGSEGWALILMGIHFLCGLFLMLGYKSRWAAIGAFVMTTSIHNRNWLINNGGDDILRAILCLSIFFPLAQYFSMDHALTKKPKESKKFFSTWGMAFYFQVFAIYYISYILKDSPIWRSEFTAAYFAAQLDIFQSDFGFWVRQFPGILKTISIFTIGLEWMGPLALFGAFVAGRFWWVVRLLVVLGFIGLHLGIALTMSIGLFPYICMSMWMLFLPPQVWDYILGKFRAKNFGKLHIYFDGECGFCKKGVFLLREFFLLPEVGIDQAQDYPEIHAQMIKEHSWVVVNESGERFYKFSAAIELFKHSPILFPFVSFFKLPIISFIGDKIYVWISHHRPFMGKATQYLEWREEKKEIKLWKYTSETLGLIMFILLFGWNLTTIKKIKVKFPVIQKVVRWIHLYQEWNMFAPYPKQDNVWVEVIGDLSNGQQVEVLTESHDIFSIKDQAFYKTLKSDKWRKFFLNVTENSTNSKYLAAYLCRKWNDRHLGFVPNTTLRKMEVKVYSQFNLLNYEKGDIRLKHSWKHWCFDEDYDKDNPKQ